jgi:two-component system response regulator MtrA
VHASRLRKKLGGNWVQTVWGIGYRLAPGIDP